MIRLHKNTMTKQRGFSLIEALVAFLILSVGMLGIASLQLHSLRAASKATVHTVAVIKTEEMLERIRNNPVVLDPNNPLVAGSGYVVVADDLGDDNGCNDSGSVSMCNHMQMARDDIYNWKADLKTSMPDNVGTTATIDVLPPIPGVLPTATVIITINWLERDAEAQATEKHSYRVFAHICDNTGC